MGTSRELNPAVKALIEMKRSGLYTDDDIRQQARELEIDLRELKDSLTREVLDKGEVKPVTTLKTINNEEMVLEAPLDGYGPMMTDRRHRAEEELRSQVKKLEEEHEKKPPVA